MGGQSFSRINIFGVSKFFEVKIFLGLTKFGVNFCGFQDPWGSNNFGVNNFEGLKFTGGKTFGVSFISGEIIWGWRLKELKVLWLTLRG